MKWRAKIAAYVEVHGLPELSSSSLTMFRRRIGFCASRDLVEYVCVPEGHNTGIQSVAVLPPGCVCYRTEIFFPDFRLTALSFPLGKIRRALKNVPITVVYCS
jgi:hypothetical protein